jgi:hypothetical protein
MPDFMPSPRPPRGKIASQEADMPRSKLAVIWCCTLALVVAWAAAPNTRAQDPAQVMRDKIMKDLPLLVIVRPGQNAGEEVDEPVAAPQRPIVILSRARIDQMLFGSSRTEAARASDLESILEARIASAERDRPLSDPEKKKLQLAGRGDIKYLLDRVEEVRAILDGNDRVRIALDDYQQLVNELRPLRATFSQGPFGDGSLFAKALRTIRQREQDAGRGAR